MSDERIHLNLFPIEGLGGFELGYRLYRVEGIAAGDNYEPSRDLVRNRVATHVRRPVVALRRDADYLAVPKDVEPDEEYQAGPVIARLVSESGAHALRFDALNPDDAALAARFVDYALAAALRVHARYWGRGHVWYRRDPRPDRVREGRVEMHPGFIWSVVTQEHRLFVALDVTHGYVERAWLSERLAAPGEASRFNGRRVVYYAGARRFIAQLQGPTGQSVAKQRFPYVKDGAERIVDVLTFSRENYGSDPRARALDPESAAILCRFARGGKQYAAAAALAKLKVTTQDPEARELQRRAVLAPHVRLPRIREEIASAFGAFQLDGRTLSVSDTPLEVPRRSFTIPPLEFGQGKVLAVEGTRAPAGAERVHLDSFGLGRLRLLTDNGAGPISTSTFGRQYVFVPHSLPRDVVDDVHARFVRTMRQFSRDEHYDAEVVRYDDAQPSLLQLRQAVTTAKTRHGIDRGYALFILPDRAHAKFHDVVKREHWPSLQMQCADARALQAHYRATAEGTWQVRGEVARKYGHYIEFCALAVLALNRFWLWSLACAQHFDLHVGLDVLGGTAGITLVADQARAISFGHHESKQREKLTTGQTRAMMAADIGLFLEEHDVQPRRILLQRDGTVFDSEIRGMELALNDLRKAGRVPLDATVTVVELRKHTSSHLRLFALSADARVENPLAGTYHALSAREAIVALTGRPFRIVGTANPLTLELAHGPGPIEDVIEDLFGLAQLGYTSPETSSKLPITIKFCDDFLRPVASDTDLSLGFGLEESTAETLTDAEAADETDAETVATKGAGTA